MPVEYTKLQKIDGPLIIVDGIQDAGYDEIVEITVGGSEKKLGQIITLDGSRAVVQVFEGTSDISLLNTRVRCTGRQMRINLSQELLGRVFDGVGRPIDGMGDIYAETSKAVDGMPINPVSREYPKSFIQTGISSIDVLSTLIRGQKLPVFSGNGLPHDELAAQIVRQAKITGAEEGSFGIVFAAMGVKNDVAEFFRRSFERSGALSRVTMFLNLVDDPVVERIITPRAALTAAEYLAFEKGMHILTVLTDMTAYAEALREISSSKGEIPSRKGFPGYLYSDLAAIYERAGIVRGLPGSVTQIPILTMPNDDITHPVPDLTGYITEGQIVLERGIHQRGIYPPVSVLPSLSRLMKDGIGKGFTREDHPELANQLFASYARVADVRALASVIGEDELSEGDKKYIEFGRAFESEFIGQGEDENRSIEKSLDLGWRLLTILPKADLDRIEAGTMEKYYKKD